MFIITIFHDQQLHVHPSLFRLMERRLVALIPYPNGMAQFAVFLAMLATI